MSVDSPNKKHRPVMAFDSLTIGAGIMAVGMLASREGGYWAMIIASILAAITTVIAIASPGGSLLRLVKEISVDLYKNRTRPRK